MKTRNLLLAFALPTLFAACTAEEIVNQADNNAVLENRALLGDLVVNVEGNVASRASWSEEDLKWGAWEEGDAFTAALTDAVTAGVAGDKLYTNYVWKKNAAGEWSTTSQMVEGLYSFYSYKGNVTKNDRSLVKFDITNQKGDLDEPTKVLNDYQLFFSPLYDIKAANTTAEKNVALPLTFYPYHSIAAFYIKNSSGQDLQISQIVAKGSFAAKGEIKPAKIQGENFVYSVRKDAEGNYLNEYKLKYKTAPTTTAAGVEYNAKEIAKMWEMSDLAGVTAENMAKQVVLNCDNWTLADGEEVLAYMNIPAGEQTEFSVEINVVDEKGNAKTVFVQNSKNRVNDEDEEEAIYSIASSGLNKTSFVRGTATAVFGLKSGAPKKIEIAENNLADASGIYVDDEEGLLNLIADGRGDVLVYNAGDLVLNSTIADALAENTACNLIFANPIAIQDFENTVNLTKVTFKDKVTVKDEYEADGTTATEEGTVVVFGEDVKVEEGMEVEKYSTVTMNNGEYDNVTNKGTLTVYAADAKITGKIDNSGTLTTDNGSAPEEETTSRSETAVNIPTIETTDGSVKVIGMDAVVTLKGGSLEYEADVDDDDENIALEVTKLTINRASTSSASITIGEDVTWKLGYALGNAITTSTSNGVTSISKKTSITNNGTIESGFDLEFADVTNNGIIEAKEKAIFVYGTMTNNKTVKAGNVFVHNANVLTVSGSLINDGYMTGNVYVDHGGYVEAKAGSAMTLVNSNDSALPYARINNTEGGNLGMSDENFASTKYVIYHKFNDFDLGDLQKLNTPLYRINTIVVEGVYTVDKNDLDSNLPIYEDCLNRFEFKNGSSMVVAAGTELYSDDNVYVEGNVTFSGWSAETSKVYLSNATLTVAKNAELTLRNILLDGASADAKMTLTLEEGTTTTDEDGKVEVEGTAKIGTNVNE